MGDFIEKHLWDGSGEDEGKTSAALANGAKLVRMINMEKAPFFARVIRKAIDGTRRLITRQNAPGNPSPTTKRQPRRLSDAPGKQVI